MINIRPAAESDFGTLIGLIDALAGYEELAPPDEPARERLKRDGFGPAPRFNAYLAEVDGRPVAYAITYDTYSSFLARPTLYLEDIFVLPEARGRGVGKAIFRHLVRAAREGGYGRMEWVVLDWNQPAIDFYERLGGRRLREWHTYRLETDEMDRLLAGGEGS